MRERAAEKAKAAREAEAKKKVLDDAKIKLMEKLELVHKAREDEAERLRSEEAELLKRKMFLGAEKDVVEAKVHEQLTLGAEREAKARQERAQQEELAQERIRIRERKILESNIRKERRRKKLADEAAKEKIMEAKRLCTEFTHHESQRKKAQAAVEKARYKKAVAFLKTINPYATSMNSFPRDSVRHMSKTELVKFYEGRVHSVRKALHALYGDAITFDPSAGSKDGNVRTVREAASLIYEGLQSDRGAE